MGRNVFSDISKNLERSTFWYIFGLLLFGYGAYMGWRLFLEDYNANLAIASIVPTKKVFEDATIATMARFIQLAPVIFGYAWLRDATTKNAMPFIVSTVFLLTDLVIGVLYRSDVGSVGLGWTIYSIIEDLVFFTAGSEILLMFCFGTLYAMIQPKVVALWDSRGNTSGRANKIVNKDKLPNKIDLQAIFQGDRTNERTRTKGFKPANRKTNAANDPFKKDKIIHAAKHWKNQHGSYPSVTKLAEMYGTSKGYVSDVMSAEFDDYGSG